MGDSMAKSAKFGKRTLKARSVEFSFKIEAYTPETFPMLRLGEYISQFGRLMGEQANVHFQKLTAGSTNVATLVDWEAAPKVKQTLAAVRRGDAEQAAMGAFRHINKMLRDDNATAECRVQGQRAVILQFPGRNEQASAAISLRQQGSVVGFVNRVGLGVDATAHVQLVVGEKKVSTFETTNLIAKELGKLLGRPVRMTGDGKWKRDEEGLWAIEQFTIFSFEAMEEEAFVDALEKIRQVGLGWTETAYDDLIAMRSEKKH
jgi:hypothetical protein